ncbi:DUF4148 domain-containing protein [Xylophilus rhododendri]|uniref:DUF4148 domain-containing protein n=1 Tax=Xylophilus rhododendri TaxID=2697032 RepID=A0A857J5D9_9BURK|nr:DUF4148 domain-containing protein [Xylophilus rhododendri]QHI98433.1 DUF4148 domain-containing protein [Xylophilus rhododendri]
MNRFALLAIALSAAVSTASFAQSAAAQPAGKTRAEVVAEMEAARARGELQAGHQWGIDVPPTPVARRQVQVAGSTN